MIQPVKSFTKEELKVKVFETATGLGEAAAAHVAGILQSAIADKGWANLILATGASQFAFLDALKKLPIAWEKITVFHLDEYVGLSDQHPASFRKYLKERILDIVKPATVYLLNGDTGNPEKEARRYEELLASHPIDIACIGIGENGHIAFNDPDVADFHDPRGVKVARLDLACRMQQLGEGWFPTLEDVPSTALTLTIPTILRCKAISCVVPDERKTVAVFHTLNGEISTSCPASILRTHPASTLFLDLKSAGRITF